MEVIILAGGLGTRLRSEVKDVPKCMAPINGKPFLWYLLEYVKRFPVTKVILSLGYLCEVVVNWIKENEKGYFFSFDFAIEEEPLGTGGGIKLALEKATTDDVIVLNGDTFFNVDLEEFLRLHIEHCNQISLALKTMKNFDRYGEVVTFGDEIVSFKEKHLCPEGLINGGIYAIKRDTDMMLSLNKKFSFEKNVLEKNVGSKELGGFKFDGFFIDIGIPEDYYRAKRELIKTFVRDQPKELYRDSP